MPSDLISIGLAVVDYLFLCDVSDEGLMRRAADHLVQGGGLAATAAVTMARLGASVEMWTRVGDDPGGRFILDQFESEGVDTSQVRVIPGGRSPASAVTVDRGTAERHFTYFRGRGLDATPDGLELSRVDSARAVLVDTHWPEAERAALDRARACGVPTCGDFEHIDERSLDLIARVDYPVYARECVQAFGRTGRIEDDLRAVAPLGGRVPMVTLGAEGCIWLEDGEIRRCRAFPVAAVDTTGCGDVFHGAFTYGLAQGWDVARNARFASAVAALKCRALGGRTGIPSLDEVEGFLARTG